MTLFWAALRVFIFTRDYLSWFIILPSNIVLFSRKLFILKEKKGHGGYFTELYCTTYVANIEEHYHFKNVFPEMC